MGSTTIYSIDLFLQQSKKKALLFKELLERNRLQTIDHIKRVRKCAARKSSANWTEKHGDHWAWRTVIPPGRILGGASGVAATLRSSPPGTAASKESCTVIGVASPRGSSWVKPDLSGINRSLESKSQSTGISMNIFLLQSNGSFLSQRRPRCFESRPQLLFSRLGRQSQAILLKTQPGCKNI